MVLRRTLLAALACAAIATAQFLSDEDGDRLADFPPNCVDTCDSFGPTALQCSQDNPSESAADQAAMMACMCTENMRTAIEACGSCISSATPDWSTSESGAVILQLAISFTRNCGMSIAIDGVPAEISSVLADGGSDYTSERAALSSSLQQAAATETSSDDAEQTGGARTTASFTSAASQTDVAQVASKTGSSSAPAASQTGDAGSGAAGLAFSGALAALAAVAAAAVAA
ncbi:hypothetical protein JCM10449v2_001879 [Rhodotorula kratochvilovae]